MKKTVAHSKPKGRAKPTRRAEPAKGPRIITCEADIKAGVRSLRRRCSIMRAVHDATGDPPLRRRPAGFEGLARIIVGQQLSVASAAAIWTRTEALVKPFEAKRLARLSDDDLRGAGLSRPKVRTLRAAAEAAAEGALPLMGMDNFSDAQVHEALTAVSGIGPWTADIYLMFCMGRADSWAPGDLALQIAVQQAMDLEARPGAAELAEIALTWKPWRGVAARLLWSYYAVMRQPKSGQPL